MILTTLGGESIWLVPYTANQGEFSCELSCLNSSQVGLTMRESREARDQLARRKITFNASLDPDQVAQMQAGLSLWQNQRILVPFWPCERLALATDNASHTGHIRIWWNGAISDGSYEIRQSASSYPSSPSLLTVDASTRTAPVLYGRFDSMPTFAKPLPDGSEVWRFTVIEVGDSTTELSAQGYTLTNGSSVNGQAVPKLTVPVDWLGRTGGATVKIFREPVGYGREDAISFYAHYPRFDHKISGTAFGTEVIEVCTLFTNRSASVRPFWLQSERDSATFIYGRFKDDTIKLSWERSALGGEEIATFDFSFTTLPAEQSIPTGETYGVTTGPVYGTGRWFGYKITNSASTWLYTSHGTAVTGAAGTFQPINIEHGSITEGIDLEVSDTTLKLSDFAGNPFSVLLMQIAAEPIWVTIYEGTLDAPMSAAVIYNGRAVKPSADGNVMSVTLRGFSSWLKSKGPRRLLLPNCTASIGDSRCGYTQSGMSNTLTSTSGSILTFATNGIADHMLIGGWAERTMPDGSKQRYAIADSYTTAGNLTVSVFGALVPIPTGTESGWKLFRGCDRTWGTCKSLGNTANFRGFPRIPINNPSIAADTGSGGKKG